MTSPSEPNTVLFISPDTFGYYRAISAAIAQKGLTPIWLNQLPTTSALSRVLFRLAPNLAKFLANDHFRRELEKIDHLDTILIIKGEGVSEATIRLMRKCFPKARIVLYLWDSLHNVPGAERKIELCDAAFSFDPTDCDRNKRLIHLPLFHSTKKSSASQKPGFAAFIGTLHSNRYKQITMLSDEIEKANGIKPFLYFYYPNRVLFSVMKLFNKSFRKVSTASVHFAPISRDQYAKIDSESEIAIDICHPRQTGLTMRTIEALGEGKKIITNNKSILRYDFYRPDNCYVVNDLLGTDFGDFLHSPYRTLPDNMVASYHIDSWIDTLLRASHRSDHPLTK